MSTRKILFLVPFKARDLEGHALVGYHLRRRHGYDIVFSNSDRVEEKLLRYAPDALVMDHLIWDFKVQQVQFAKKLGIKVIVLPTEGLLQSEDDVLLVTGYRHSQRPNIDLYLSWGDFHRNAVMKKGFMTEDQIKTVGCPRFDFYSEPYLSLLEPKERFLSRWGIRNPDAPIILWATNTTYTSQDPKKVIQRYISGGAFTTSRVQDFLRDGSEQHQQHSQVVLALARLHPEWNFIIKIHPSELIDSYVPLTKNLPNVHLAFDAPIRDFLFHCDVLLQRNCTTATEAWMLGKPVLQLEMGSYSCDSRSEYKNGNHVVMDLDDADQAIRAYLSGMPVPDEQKLARQAFIGEFYFQVDGKASERCSELIDRVVSADHTEVKQAAVRVAAEKEFVQWKRRQDSRLTNRFKDSVGLNREVSLRLWKRFLRRNHKPNLGLFVPAAEITPDMVDKLYQRYDQVLSGNLALSA